MSAKGLIWRGVLALAGSMLGAYIGQDLIGGGAFGWIVGGAIVGGCIAPLFKTLFAWNEARARASAHSEP